MKIPWNDPHVPLAEIVRNNQAMAGIRECANNCLRQVKIEFTLAELLED
jgi:hypothetical protein